MENWFLYAIIGAISLSFMALLIRFITTKGLSPVLTMTYLFTIVAIILWGYSAATEKIIMPSTWIMVALIGASVLSAVANVLVTTSIKESPNPGYTQALTSVNIILVTILSIVLFGLKVNFTGILGVVVILAGVLLLSLA